MSSAVTQPYFPVLADIYQAAQRIAEVADPTPLQKSIRLSKKYGAEIWLKREDLHRVRSYKIRGAYNKISSLSREELASGVVCASAGNHAQGVAFACAHLKVKGAVFMPVVTPKQKIDQTRLFGGEYVEVILEGDTFDDAYGAASPARGIVLAMYTAILLASIAFLFKPVPAAVAALLAIQIIYKVLTPVTVGSLANPVVTANLAIAALHAVTLGFILLRPST